MTKQDYEQKIQELEAHIRQLQQANIELVNRNMQMSQQLDAFYDVRRRIQREE